MEYSVHPAVEHARAIIANLPTKTGRSIDEWAGLVRQSGPDATRARRDWLKSTHRLGGTTAAMIVSWAEGRGAEDTDPDAYLTAAAGYVETMYGGPKQRLKPIHDRVIELTESLGDDVKISPCQTIVPLYREHVFAQLKPATWTRVDLGLALKGAKRTLPKRLIDTGGLKKGDRITHRIALATVAEIDDQVELWLRTAYELDS